MHTFPSNPSIHFNVSFPSKDLILSFLASFFQCFYILPIFSHILCILYCSFCPFFPFLLHSHLFPGLFFSFLFLIDFHLYFFSISSFTSLGLFFLFLLFSFSLMSFLSLLFCITYLLSQCCIVNLLHDVFFAIHPLYSLIVLSTS